MVYASGVLIPSNSGRTSIRRLRPVVGVGACPFIACQPAADPSAITAPAPNVFTTRSTNWSSALRRPFHFCQRTMRRCGLRQNAPVFACTFRCASTYFLNSSHDVARLFVPSNSFSASFTPLGRPAASMSFLR